MSLIVKSLFLFLGLTRKRKEEPRRKKNATKFSKSLKQSIKDDVQELTSKIQKA